MSFASRARLCAVAALAALGLTACAAQTGPYSYAPYEAGMIARVEEGTIVSARPIRLETYQNGSGGLVGGVAGAAIGSQFGGDTGGTVAGAVIGGLLGAVAGDAIANNENRNGFAYVIRRERDGSMIEIAQPDVQPLPLGMRVHIAYGDRVRVTPATY